MVLGAAALATKQIMLFLILVLACVSFSYAQSPLMDGLVTYYKLDETSGTLAQDYFGVYNGTADNARVFTSEINGIINTGADFTQGNDNIAIPSGAIDTTNDFTVSYWFNSSSMTGVQVHIGLLDQRDVRFFTDETSYIFRQWSGSAGTSDVTKSSLSSDTWYHICAIRDGNTARLVINGVLEDTNTGIGSVSVSSADNALGYRVGVGQYYSGMMDEVAFYSDAKTVAFCQDLYDAQKNGFVSGQPPFTIPSENFQITATDAVTSAPIMDFDATVNGTPYSTTNGTIITPFLRNESILLNITVSSVDHSQKTFNNYNISENLNAQLVPVTHATVTFQATKLYTDLLVPAFNVTFNSTTKPNTDPFLIPRNLVFNASFSAGGYFPSTQQLETDDFPTQTVSFTNVFTNSIDITAFNNLTLNPISNFTFSLNQTPLTLHTTNGLINFNHSKVYLSSLQLSDFVFLGNNEYEYEYFTRVFDAAIATPPLIPGGTVQKDHFDEGCLDQSPLLIQNVNDAISCFDYDTSSFVSVGNLETGSMFFIYYDLEDAAVSLTADTYLPEHFTGVNLSNNFPASLFSTNTLNISFVDEITLQPTLNVTFDLIGALFSQRYVTTTGSVLVEGIGEGTYEIRYGLNDTDRRPRSYYFGVPIEKTDAQLQLKTLEQNVSQLFVRRVVDNNAQPLKDHIYELQRYYTETSTWQTVERALISTNGEAVFSAIPNTQAYRYRVLNPDFQIIETSTAFFLIDQTAEIRVNIEPPAFQTYNNFRKIQSSLHLSQAGNYVFEYVDASNTVQEVCLTVEYSFQLNTTTQENCMQQTSGTIILPINLTAPGIYTATATAQFQDGTFTLAQDVYKFNEVDALQILGVIAFILLLIGVGTAGVLSFVQPVVGLVFLFVLFIGFSPMIMGLIEVSLVATTTITLMGVLILIIYTRFR